MSAITASAMYFSTENWLALGNSRTDGSRLSAGNSPRSYRRRTYSFPPVSATVSSSSGAKAAFTRPISAPPCIARTAVVLTVTVSAFPSVPVRLNSVAGSVFTVPCHTMLKGVVSAIASPVTVSHVTVDPAGRFSSPFRMVYSPSAVPGMS